MLTSCSGDGMDHSTAQGCKQLRLLFCLAHRDALCEERQIGASVWRRRGLSLVLHAQQCHKACIAESTSVNTYAMSLR